MESQARVEIEVTAVVPDWGRRRFQTPGHELLRPRFREPRHRRRRHRRDGPRHRADRGTGRPHRAAARRPAGRRREGARRPRATFKRRCAAGQLGDEQAQAATQRVCRSSPGPGRAGQTVLVVEAIVEDLGVKRALSPNSRAIVAPDCVLATNPRRCRHCDRGRLRRPSASSVPLLQPGAADKRSSRSSTACAGAPVGIAMMALARRVATCRCARRTRRASSSTTPGAVTAPGAAPARRERRRAARDRRRAARAGGIPARPVRNCSTSRAWTSRCR